RDARPTRSFWRSWRCEERDDTGVVCGGQFRHEKVFRVPAGATGAPLRMYHFQIPANGGIVNGQKFLKGPAETSNEGMARTLLRAGAKFSTVIESRRLEDGQVERREVEPPSWSRPRRGPGKRNRREQGGAN